jgi:hypothetical protein
MNKENIIIKIVKKQENNETQEQHIIKVAYPGSL